MDVLAVHGSEQPCTSSCKPELFVTNAVGLESETPNVIDENGTVPEFVSVITLSAWSPGTKFDTDVVTVLVEPTVSDTVAEFTV